MADSISDLVRGMEFKDKDIKQLSTVLIFSHDSLTEQLLTFKEKVKKCEDGIHCNEDEIKKLKSGEYTEDAIKKAVTKSRQEMLKYVGLVAAVIAALAGLLEYMK